MTSVTSSFTQGCQVAVIGGGILGVAVAALLAQQEFSVTLFRLSNLGRPRAETLRNQGWLQSGLMYVGRFGNNRERGHRLAAQMYQAGRNMLDFLKLPQPQEFGIIRIADDQREKLLDDAAKIRVSHLVNPLSNAEAKGRLGPAFAQAGQYFTIPDAPFPEGRIIEIFRKAANAAGVRFIECDKDVSVQKDNRSPSGHVVCNGSSIFAPQATVLAAGVGSYKLLQDLGIDPRMRFQKTPLMVVKGSHSVSAPLFVDRVGGFSMVRHSGNERAMNGALVVGTKEVEENAPRVPFDLREIDKPQKERFRKWLPDYFKPLVDVNRFTVGYEVVPDRVKDEDENDIEFFEPWVKWTGAEQGVRMLMAMPGRATMGLQVASEAVQMLVDAGLEPSQNSNANTAAQWIEDIYMHYEDFYEFDDSKSQTGSD